VHKRMNRQESSPLSCIGSGENSSGHQCGRRGKQTVREKARVVEGGGDRTRQSVEVYFEEVEKTVRERRMSYSSAKRV